MLIHCVFPELFFKQLCTVMDNLIQTNKEEEEEAPKKYYFSMGEVCEMFDVAPSLVRYWHSEFPEIRPLKNKKGNRLFRPQDVETIKLI